MNASIESAPVSIGERYRIERTVASTEAGVELDATDRVGNRRVTVEVASSLEEPRARLAWSRDAMMAQRLEGEHVLRVLDVGVLPDGVPYVVREVSVSTLAAEVAARGPLPVQQAVGWTLEACEAVAEAHALGMAHGDLRPENVHLARGAHGMSVKVAWTSAAKAERAAKEDVARDIAALGALLRLLVAGPLDPAQDGAPTLPSDIAHVIARALAEDPAAAFHNVAELARALAPCAPPGHESARTIAFMLSRAGIVSSTIPITPPAERRSLTDEWFGRGPRRPLDEAPAPASHRARRFALVAIALVGFVLGATWFLWQRNELPHWTGTAPPEVGTTHTTGAPAAQPEPAATADEPTAVPVDSLPSVAPARTEAPKPREAPARTEAPKTREAPARTEAPALQEAPASTDMPASTDTPRATDTPAPAEPPSAPEAPAN